MPLSRRVRSISPSSTLAITAMAKRMQAEGIDVISFAGGEPEFDTPEHVKAAGIRAVRDGFTKYTAPAGIEELRDAVVAKLKRDNGLEYTQDEVVTCSGSKQALYNLAMVFFDKRDEVIIPAPYWVSYPEQVRLADATPVFAPTREEEGFRLKRGDLERVLTRRTKAVILNSPCNPTGAVIELDELKAIAELAVEKDFYLVSDEAYEALTYDGVKHVSIASLGEEVKARTFVVGSTSKTYAMTGWRLGYAAGPKEIIKAMIDLQSHSTSAPASPSQKAAVAALLGPRETVESMRREFEKRRRYLLERLHGIPGVRCVPPEGAFYAFPNVSAFYGKKVARGRKISSSTDLTAYLIQEARVTVVPGADFGSDKHVRISYCLGMEQIRDGLERMAKALEQLK
ncbi:MAG: pyridoxal phosphate-dependent aminotransferase [candidate division NC10 bacterium]|nr:pyridoxal phosphate-dependent aminotransferase [candidate division NC10 bacterium]